MNSLLNRVAIAKERNKESEQVLSQNELNTIFSRVARKILDFSDYEYMKIFPIMCGEEENSYIKKVKYFRKQEREKKNYKLAEHYISYWFNRNETLEKME